MNSWLGGLWLPGFSPCLSSSIRLSGHAVMFPMWCGRKSISRSAQVFFLDSLITSHWPNQVTWPSPKPEWRDTTVTQQWVWLQRGVIDSAIIEISLPRYRKHLKVFLFLDGYPQASITVNTVFQYTWEPIKPGKWQVWFLFITPHCRDKPKNSCIQMEKTLWKKHLLGCSWTNLI